MTKIIKFPERIAEPVSGEAGGVVHDTINTFDELEEQCQNEQRIDSRAERVKV